MSATRDITERLRKQGRWITTKRVPLIPQMDEEEWRTDPVCAEAATEIEALRRWKDAHDALEEYVGTIMGGLRRDDPDAQEAAFQTYREARERATANGSKGET